MIPRPYRSLVVAALLTFPGCAARNEPCPMAVSVEAAEAAASKAEAAASKAEEAARLAAGEQARASTAADKVEDDHRPECWLRP